MPRSSTCVVARKSPDGERAMLVAGDSTRKMLIILGKEVLGQRECTP